MFNFLAEAIKSINNCLVTEPGLILRSPRTVQHKIEARVGDKTLLTGFTGNHSSVVPSLLASLWSLITDLCCLSF